MPVAWYTAEPCNIQLSLQLGGISSSFYSRDALACIYEKVLLPNILIFIWSAVFWRLRFVQPLSVSSVYTVYISRPVVLPITRSVLILGQCDLLRSRRWWTSLLVKYIMHDQYPCRLVARKGWVSILSMQFLSDCFASYFSCKKPLRQDPKRNEPTVINNVGLTLKQRFGIVYNVDCV